MQNLSKFGNTTGILTASFTVFVGAIFPSTASYSNLLQNSRQISEIASINSTTIIEPIFGKRNLQAPTIFAGGYSEEPDDVENSTTSSVVSRITNGNTFCSTLPSEYKLDCLAQTLNSAGSAAAKSAQYAGPSKILKDAGNRLSTLVSQNEDKSKPKLNANGKSFRAVKKSVSAAVNRKAIVIIVETETKLLRSAGNSAKRKIHFSRIAKAVGSTKTLLRST